MPFAKEIGLTDSTRSHSVAPLYMNEHQLILVVDDSEDDIMLMRHAFEAAHFKPRLQAIVDGEDAIAYLAGNGEFADRSKYPLPTVMLLDLNMPKKSGLDVLLWVRAQPQLKLLSIIVFSASARAEDVNRAFLAGANSYLVKPGSVSELIAMMCSLRDWLECCHFPMLR